ncbi:EamA family transporter RarD [Hirschia litorea]|uniref:EamA family transporter RarD n=1 Tax=Hirschia litorea TaxID=1199156 RepID=A0ABW2IM57_9PROT
MNMKSTSDAQFGLFAAIGAYSLWGFLPLYFKILENVPPLTMLTQRMAWSVPTGLLLVVLAGRWKDFAFIFKTPRTLGLLIISGALMGCNWLIFIWAVQNGRILEGSLGYFINPLFSFGLAAIFFSERFSKLQILAIILAAIGVLNQTIVVGQFPWVAISLCVTFGFYGVIRKNVVVDSRAGFLLEVLLLFPFAIAYLIYVWTHGGAPIADTTRDSILVSLSGVVTAAPLILFALAAKRLRLSTVAIMQYIGPTIQFCVGLYFGEAFTQGHAVTFGFIWAGVLIFCISAWQNGRRAKIIAAE